MSTSPASQASAISSAVTACPICAVPRTHRVYQWNSMDTNKCPACHVLFVISPPSMEEPVRMYGGHDLLHERLDPNSKSEGELPSWKMKDSLLDLFKKWGASAAQVSKLLNRSDRFLLIAQKPLAASSNFS
jgi:hypothetical protein